MCRYWPIIIFVISLLCKVVIVTCKLSENEEGGTIDTYSAPPPSDSDSTRENVILWWTPFTGIYGQSRSCPLGTCYFTENRDYLKDKLTKAVLFYGSDFNVEDLPLPRPHGQWWALLHEESPKNQPLFDHETALSLFNLTSTFRQASDFPITLQHLASIESLTSTEEYVPLQDKILLAEQDNLAPVIYVQSDCDTPSERDKYVQELSNYIKIDSYGSCLHNRDLPSHLHDPAANYDHADFRKIVAKYKFALAIENAACDDYITEKLWRPLSVGTIPLYWGSPSIDEWIPNPKSIIDIRNFGSPEQLAEYLHTVIQNDVLYESHLEHKLEGLVSNLNLLDAMDRRKWGINNDFERGNFIEHFECYVCDQIITESSKISEDQKTQQVTASHYGCTEPQSVLTGEPNPKSFWVEEWHKARVEAEVLHRLVSTAPGVFTSNQFYAEVIGKLQSDGFFRKYRERRDEL